MSSESFFTDVVLSYQQILSRSETPSPSLRDYCRSRHVAYSDFKRWASTNQTASALLEKERAKKSKPVKRKYTKRKSVSASCVSTISNKPILSPLHILSIPDEDRDTGVKTGSEPSILRGMRIIYPTGVKVFIKEAIIKDISCLICNKDY